jgi:uncharacterized membrane protein YhaH (DUF805 family)
MKLFDTLFSTRGTVDRGTYALVGLIGFAIKHNLDRIVATYGFHRPWGFFNYVEPVRDVGRIMAVHGEEAWFLATLVALSLPFIWVGVVMTMKRLRSAKLPQSLLVVFFLPFLNLLFFLVLCLLPGHVEAEALQTPRESWLSRIVPESASGSAAISLVISVPLGLGISVFGAKVLATYGWGLFLAVPFTEGFVAALVYGVRKPRSFAGCIGVACLAVTILGACLIATAVEGLICLFMAIPLAFPLAAFGGACAYAVQRRRRIKREAPAFLAALLLFTPGMEWVEHVIARPSPIYMVRTSLDIHGSPDRVWKQVVAFSEIAPPREWMFRAGVAYPIRARIVGSGVGAERHCEFSTGAFVEPIEVWDEPRELKFSVTSNPAPLEEWTPYSHLDIPHMHGFLVSEGGQFLLTPLPDGGTRLEGTTWYQHGLWPAAYWRLWSDDIIHAIHRRVLKHIRDEVEDQR